MNDILRTPLHRLETEQRLVNPRFKAKTQAPRRFGYHGDVVLRFLPNVVGQAQVPLSVCGDVLTIALEGAPTIPFLAGTIAAFAELKDVADVLAGLLKGGGKYFLFCAQVDAASGVQVPLGGVMWYLLPRRAASLEADLTKLLYFDELALEGLDPGAKLDALADEAMKYDVTFDMLTYAEGVARWSVR
jgi:hypothetical protein